MKVKAPFVLNEQIHPSVLTLLKKTRLGTNGAIYRHLNTEEIAHQLDNPLFLSLFRKEQAIANCTFCRRQNQWYIRYFAFDQLFQSNHASSKPKKGGLKEQVQCVFDTHIQDGGLFYAYIEPRNQRSLHMSSTFGFEVIGHLHTYFFSRKKAKAKYRIIELSSLEVETYLEQFSNKAFFHQSSLPRAKFLAIRDQHNTIIATARVQSAAWELVRLPGKWGSLLTKCLPYIPVVRNYIKPKKHEFLTLDSILVSKEVNVDDFLESILAHENMRICCWWEDVQRAEINQRVKSWGIVRKLIGKPSVAVVCKGKTPDLSHGIYVSAVDLI